MQWSWPDVCYKRFKPVGTFAEVQFYSRNYDLFYSALVIACPLLIAEFGSILHCYPFSEGCMMLFDLQWSARWGLGDTWLLR